MEVKAPKKPLSVKEILSTGKVIEPKVSKDGKLLLDKNNPVHIRFWED